jgi:hypothetical protein
VTVHCGVSTGAGTAAVPPMGAAVSPPPALIGPRLGGAPLYPAKLGMGGTAGTAILFQAALFTGWTAATGLAVSIDFR